MKRSDILKLIKQHASKEKAELILKSLEDELLITPYHLVKEKNGLFIIKHGWEKE